MNIYKRLNEISEYIEKNLENDINYQDLAKIIGTNEYTMRRMFSFLCDISVSEYIRNRRLSNAGFDLYKGNEKIVDIAVKYQYNNATAFSRAFEKFHGIKPSVVKSDPSKLKVFTKLQFDEKISTNSNMEYNIVELDEKVLYGIGKKTTEGTIKYDAPKFFAEMKEKYDSKYKEGIDYGIIFYESRFESTNMEYCVAYEREIKDFRKIVIPKSKWLLFRIPSQEVEDIQRVTTDFFEKFLPSSKFKLRPIPELEHYYNNITDLLIPIED